MLYLSWSVYPSMHSSAKVDHVLNVRITHKTAHVPLMEAVAFKEKAQALTELQAVEGVEECLYLQTCNRIEVYLVAEKAENTGVVAKELLAKRAGEHIEEAKKAIETSMDNEAFEHLLRVTSGMESMVIGEDQILNQTWDAYLEADKAKTLGPILKHLFNRAVIVGRRVRSETGINKGAVSVGSAAVELASKLLGSLEDKKILVMGAGEMGTLVAKALARRCLSPIFIANRTYDRAVKLAQDLSGQAVKFDRFDEVMVDADVVICSTSAPHNLLTKEIVIRLMGKRQNNNTLVVIDISNPRNVEKTVTEVSGVKLYNIDDLQSIADKNKAQREAAIEKATKILEKELVILEEEMKSFSVRLIISEILSQAEETRQRELVTALNMLGDLDEHQKRVINDLTSILLKQTFIPIVENLRAAAKNGDKQTIDTAIKLFEKTEKK
ncbi:MAG: glutamyl-tRNA reductase [Candidatus Bathyarchaeota archaeon]|nr:glutamyl-tRNA reductase [Candidatus Bathyarchaeota archaeon]